MKTLAIGSVRSVGWIAMTTVLAGGAMAAEDSESAPGLGHVEVVSQSGEEKWSFQVTPYIWAAGLGGEIRPFTGAPTLGFRKPFKDVLKDLNSAFFVTAAAQRGQLVLLGDFSFSDVSRSGTVPPGVPARGGLRQVSLTLAGGARVVETDHATLDIIGGFRTWQLRGSVDVTAVGISKSPEKTFTDALVGARSTLKLAPDWTLLIYGDTGFLRTGSRETYQFVVTGNYAVSRDVTLSLGYRELGVDYRSGGTKLDVRMSGIVVGATFKF